MKLSRRDPNKDGAGFFFGLRSQLATRILRARSANS
jgi:hypothetical protein